MTQTKTETKQRQKQKQKLHIQSGIMLKMLLYILATETTGLVSKFDNSQYKKKKKRENE